MMSYCDGLFTRRERGPSPRPSLGKLVEGGVPFLHDIQHVLQ